VPHGRSRRRGQQKILDLTGTPTPTPRSSPWPVAIAIATLNAFFFKPIRNVFHNAFLSGTNFDETSHSQPKMKYKQF
jgi:hypothetical protein